ncbi:MAG: DUF952 domain-containing protein [Proteobacteria bacterium]|nr:DUF952 domain-containing protein [Pseudomonadota bacterium]
MMFIYKVCPEAMWREAEKAGYFKGAPVDLQDGFIHFSTAEQLGETLRRHFAGQSDLLLIEVDDSTFGERLKWEPSRGGALFPHLYGGLDASAVSKTTRLTLDADGHHQLPRLPL